MTRIATGGAGRFPAAFNILARMEPEEASYIALREIVNAAAVRRTAQATAMSIAGALIHHLEMRNLKGLNKAGYSGLIRSMTQKGYSSKRREAINKLLDREGAGLDFTQAEQLHAGMKMIELVNEATGLFVLEPTSHTRGIIYKLRPTEACRDWLERQHARCELLEPMYLPMVVRPRRWRSPFWGGYLTKQPNHRLVKQHSKPYLDELRSVEMPEVYSAVNRIQEVPWRINRRVFEVMREVWDGGGSLGGLPPRDNLPVPPRPTSDDPALLQQWKQAAAEAHAANSRLMSKRLTMSQRLWIGSKYLDEEAIWFPHALDFRGRVYPIPAGGGIHPQADDAGKALLEFARGVPLGDNGPGWLAVHIANLFGVDKVPFEERVDWVMANHDAIMDSADNPLDGHRFWTTADSPWSALAACIEWAGYTREGPTFLSRVPVALDGSNSGLQHFSAMLRDPEGASAVNLVPSDRPQDIYMRVAKRAQEIVDADESAEAVPWKGDKVVRKIAKQPCMTYCYSATRYGMQAMITSALRELDADLAAEGKPPHLGGVKNHEAAQYLSHVLWQAISEVVNAATVAMSWLREVAAVAAQSELPLWWTTPAGFPVTQAYRRITGRRLDLHYGGRRVQMLLSQEEDGMDTRRQENGIAPNFIHSMDAAHLMAVVNAAHTQGIVDLAVIHDSFGCHAAYAGDLSMVLRQTFVDQYSVDRLSEFREEIVSQLPPHLAAQVPPVPPMGDLVLDDVLSSPYVFA